MTPNDELSEYRVSVTEAAAMLSVKPMTVRRWIQEGRLPAIRIPGTKPYKLRQTDIDALIEGSPVVPRAAEEATQQSSTMGGNDLVQALLDAEDADR